MAPLFLQLFLGAQVLAQDATGSGGYSGYGGYSGSADGKGGEAYSAYGESTKGTGGYDGATGMYGGYPSCSMDETWCYPTVYDDQGNPVWDYDQPMNITCAPFEEGCPCNPTWEHQCESYGMKYCEFHTFSCPVECGDKVTCWHYASGNQSCATDAGCVCEANEISCPNPDTGKAECYPTEWYATGCPVFCRSTEMYCSNITFDETGMMQWTDYCLDGESNNWWCPIHCDEATSKKCGTAGSYDEHCVAKTDDCPLTCTEEQQYCWVDSYDAQGMWLSSSETCVAASESCPCGDNSVSCTDEYSGYSYCTSALYGCPLYCDYETEKTCWPVAFTEDGLQDWDAPVQESCQAIDEPCGCGANGKMCRWVDEWGYENEVCFPEIEECPVACEEGQQRCYVTDYDESGNPGAYRETCSEAGESCQCGTNSQLCVDPFWDYSYCLPLKDSYTGGEMSCPVFCTEEQDYCYSSSYDSSGNWLSSVESCVAKGTKCTCTGQNSFACDFNEWGYTWTECLPLEGGYCPATCASGEVSCPSVEDYKPDGSFLGISNPSTQCAADWDSCPCGTEAKKCPGSSIRCIFKDEDCPAVCQEGEKTCWITDFTAGEEYISDREVCKKSDETCPCGSNTQRCPGSDICLLASQAALFCPCTEAQKQCDVQDYTTGKPTDNNVQCINKGAKCPCGQNAIACPDPNNADENICMPKYSGTVLNVCPSACTPTQEAEGKKTCLQVHLTDSGEFEREVISCVLPEKCKPGKGTQKCPTGATIPSSKTCKDPYGVGGKTDLAIAADMQETAKVILSLDASGDSSAANQKADDVRVQLGGEVYLPDGIQVKLNLKTPGSRRLSNGRISRKLATSKTVATVEFVNLGATKVTPQSVAQELKQQVKSGSSGVTKALSAVGTVDLKAGVSVAATAKSITTRAATVQQKAGNATTSGAGVTSDPGAVTTTTADSGQVSDGASSVVLSGLMLLAGLGPLF